VTPDVQSQGTAAASAARTKSAEERQSLKRRLGTLPLTTPEEVRDYLQVVLRSCATGALEARAAAACAAVASRLIASFSVSISKELDELRAAREQGEKARHDTGSSRRNR
jgi:hypothetical protein